MRLVISLETSFDDTGVAIWNAQFGLILQIVATTSAPNRFVGGIVPTRAALHHLKQAVFCLGQVLCGYDCMVLNYIKYTATPGLKMTLYVGWVVSTILACNAGVSAVAVNHVQAHVHAIKLNKTLVVWPTLAVVTSGKTNAVLVVNSRAVEYVILQTKSYAFGEVLDKCARLVPLLSQHVTGSSLARLALQNAEGFCSFCWCDTKTMSKYQLVSGFSHLLRLITTDHSDLTTKGIHYSLIAAVTVVFAFVALKQHQLIHATTTKCNMHGLVWAGGVSASIQLKHGLKLMVNSLVLHFCLSSLCTDNAGMVLC